MQPDSQSYSSSIGDNKTVTLDFSAQIGGPRQNTVGLFMQGVSQTKTTDNTGPSFTLSEVTAANQTVAGSVTGDMIFSFNEAVTDTAGEELAASDFVIRTGAAGSAAGTDTLLVADTDYTVFENLNDKTFVIRPSTTIKRQLGEAVVQVSGMMVAGIKDSLGNAMEASGDHVQSFADTL